MRETARAIDDYDGRFSIGPVYTGSAAVSPEEDAAYMDAVKRGDMETVERMKQEAVSRAMPSTKVVDGNGRPLKVYHGSRTGANI